MDGQRGDKKEMGNAVLHMRFEFGKDYATLDKLDQSHRNEHSTSSNVEKRHLPHLSSLMTYSSFPQ